MNRRQSSIFRLVSQDKHCTLVFVHLTTLRTATSSFFVTPRSISSTSQQTPTTCLPSTVLKQMQNANTFRSEPLLSHRVLVVGFKFAYSNAISTNSPMFCYESCSSSGPQYYYEPIQVSVSTTTNVTFTCNSTTFIHGHLYEAAFNPNHPQRYLLVGTGYSSAQQRFNVTRRLVASKVYILVITTYFQRDTGSFWVIASSPVVVNMTRMSMSCCLPLFDFPSG